MRRCVSNDAGPEGVWFGRGPTSIGQRNKCQRGRWSPKGGGWIVRSHTGWGGERNTLYKDVKTSLADAF